MSATTIDWDQDVEISKEESYQSLQNALNRNQGFGLYFVRSSPVQTQTIIEDIKRDLPNKKIGVLPLTDEVDNLFNLITNFPDYQNLNILFISGLELSLLRYEERESEGLFLPSQSSVYGGTWAGVPRILGHLNLSRERFREHFPFSIVFCLPEFALRYFIRRAPDFFDWRSGLFTFLDNQKVSIPTINPRTSKLFEWLGYGLLFIASIILSGIKLPFLIVYLVILFLGIFIKFFISAIIKAIRLKQDKNFVESSFIKLVWRGIRAIQSNIQGLFVLISFAFVYMCIFIFNKQNAFSYFDNAFDNASKNALSYFDNAIKFDPFYHHAWNERGDALRSLVRYEEAIASYDEALKIIPDDHKAWNNRGNALGNLGRYEEAIASYDHALQIKPDDHKAWDNRGNALLNLDRNEEAIASYDHALKIKPDDHNAWKNRGTALDDLGRYKEAITSYDQALKIKPDKQEAWYGRWIALFNLGRYEEVIASFDNALKIKPDNPNALYCRGIVLEALGRSEEAIASYDEVLKIKPDKDEAWYNRGNALGNLGRLEEAIASFDNVLKIKPDDATSYYNKSCIYSLQENIDLAIENLKQAINLDSTYLEMAKTDTDFDKIRNDSRFIELIHQSNSP